MCDSKGDYYADDFLQSEPELKSNYYEGIQEALDREFEALVDYDPEYEPDEGREIRSNIP